MPKIGARGNLAVGGPQLPESLGGVRREKWKTQRNIRLADSLVAHTWKNCDAPAARRGVSVGAAIGAREPHDDAVAPSIGAIQRDAVSNAVETDEEMNARETETFGIDANRLNADLVAGTKRFLNHYGHAENRERAVKHRKHYHVVEVSYLRDDGSVDKEERLVRSEKTRAQRIEERGTKDGERVKRTYN